MSKSVATPVWQINQTIRKIDAEIAALQERRTKLAMLAVKRIEENAAEAQAAAEKAAQQRRARNAASPFSYLHNYLDSKKAK